MLTDEQKAAYLENPNICPYCESNDLEASAPDYTGSTIEQNILCLGCNQRWIDIYKIKSIVEIA